MRYSKLFTKTKKFAPKDEVSKNAQLLVRGGFIHKEIAGVYTLLPLGLRVMNNIEQIIREEMNKVGGQEMKLTTLQTKEIWEKSGRWDDEVMNDWFKTELKNGSKLGLAPTHEEPFTRLMKENINSYRDLPQYPYQFQTKFRNELRAKSGMMRGREFLMKDMYSFSKSQEEHEEFYEKMKDVYRNVFSRLGFGDKTYLTISSGGSFSKYSYEFQTISDAGEDIIYIIDEEKNIAINKDDFNEELLKDFGLKLRDEENLRKEKSIEVGDIYSLGTKFSNAFDLKFEDENGEKKLVIMGSYGIGMSRLMGTIVEIFSDENGIIWPESVAPFKVHLISLGSEKAQKEAEKVYDDLNDSGISVFFDDREVSAGEKFADADLLGMPWRVLVSDKSIEAGGFEVKKRGEEKGEVLSFEELKKSF